MLLYPISYYYWFYWNQSVEGGQWDGGVLGAPYSYFFTIFFTASILPILFFLTKDIAWDRFLGNLSFPLYLSHEAIIRILQNMEIATQNISLYALLLSLLISVAAIYLIENPLDNYRHKKFLKKAA